MWNAPSDFPQKKELICDTTINAWVFRFLIAQFPRIESALVVADGKGELANQLVRWGIDVRAFELRKYKKYDKRIDLFTTPFTENTEITEDILISVLPCDATIPIIKSVAEQNKSFLIVPCRCFVHSEGHKSYGEYIDHLMGFFDFQKQKLFLHNVLTDQMDLSYTALTMTTKRGRK